MLNIVKYLIILSLVVVFLIEPTTCGKPRKDRKRVRASNPCIPNPCGYVNNGTTVSTGTCTQSKNNSYTCECKSGFTGVNCTLLVTNTSCFADYDNCLNGGSCTIVADISNPPVLGEYPVYIQCLCPPGFSGESCENNTLPNPCLSNPCGVNGKCTPAADNTRFTCNCTKNFTGETCNIFTGASPPTNATCDPDYIQCFNNATCEYDYFVDNTKNLTLNSSFTDLPVNAFCKCAPGYGGVFCDLDLNPCKNATLCQNGGTCKNVPGSTNYMCLCKSSYTGKSCQTLKLAAQLGSQVISEEEEEEEELSEEAEDSEE